MKKKTLLITTLAALLAILSGMLIIIAVNDVLPYDFIVKDTAMKEPYLKPLKEIIETSNNNEHFIFYYNEKSTLTCAILQKDFFSYRLLDYSAEITADDGRPHNAIYSAYNEGKSWIDWGVIENPSIEDVFVNGDEATIIKRGNLRLFYMTGDGNGEVNEQFLDKNGVSVE